MKRKETNRLYAFSDAVLIRKAFEKIMFIRRDYHAFAPYGITQDRLNALEQEVKDFSNRETDVEKLGDQAISTEKKNNKAEEVRVAIRNVQSHAFIAFGAHSARYLCFGTEVISKKKDGDLVIVAQTIVRLGYLLLNELQICGLTPDILDRLTALANELAQLTIDQKTNAALRNIAQEDRVKAGNSIYTAVNNYATLGQKLWQAEDQAKYNDYFIY
jgi:hypothetical protein